ncbi:MAG: hypothetical protein NTW97_03360 [Candidatus Krumholzibacteria bacterium]|nr:hypothetical protein [Candidatus Krumholzibacteria bacterium]
MPCATRELAAALEATGDAMGVPVKTVITAMDEPLGLAVGNALEAAEGIRILEGAGPPDVTDLTLRLVAEMLLLAGLVPGIREGESLARSAVASGRAFERFERIVAAQGGRLDPRAPAYGLPRAKIVVPLAAASSGFIARVDARAVGEAVREMGGGRFKTEDRIDPSVGVVLLGKCGDEIAAGGALFEIHASDEETARIAARTIGDAIAISREPVPRPPLYPTID